MEREPNPFEFRLPKSLTRFLGYVAKFLWDGARKNGEAIIGSSANYQEYLYPFPQPKPSAEDELDLIALKHDIKTIADLEDAIKRQQPPNTR